MKTKAKKGCPLAQTMGCLRVAFGIVSAAAGAPRLSSPESMAGSWEQRPPGMSLSQGATLFGLLSPPFM